MTRTRRPRSRRALAVTAGAVVLTGAVLSGCGTGQLAQTAGQLSAVNGASAQTPQGDIQIRDARIAYPQRPASPGVLYQRGGAAPLALTIVNEAATPDRLVRVTSPAAAAAPVFGDPTITQNVALVAGGVQGSPTPSGTRALTVTLTGLTEPVRSGLPVPVTFTFERAGSVTVRIPTSVPPEGSGEPERVDSAVEGGEQAAAPAPEAAPVAPVAPEGGTTPGAPNAPAPEGGR